MDYPDSELKQQEIIHSLDIKGDKVALGSTRGTLDVLDWRRGTKIARTKVCSTKRTVPQSNADILDIDNKKYMAYQD